MATTTSTTTRKRSVQDFQFGNRIGEGSYSTVYKAVDIQSKKVYAIKVLSKKHIVKEKKIKYVNIEKTTLNRLGRHPGVVTLYYTFQDDASLYFVIDMAEFGELLTIIRKLGSLSEECSKYYMIQIIDAVDFMHKKGIIHRDLKPENILVNSDMKLMITDFGAAKVLDLDDQGNIIDSNATEESFAKGSFVGTAEYVSPELLKYNKCGFECDIWAIGCILYQFLVGVPPFKGKTEYLTFEKIVNLQYQWPNFYIPSTIKDLVDSLLKTNPFDRLTIPQIQQHKWFGNFNWEDKNRIWVTNPPKLEPYQPIIQQHNENSQQLKKIVIQKKVPAATAKKQLLTNTLKQIKNENGSYIYTPLTNGAPKVMKPQPQIQTSYKQPINQSSPTTGQQLNPPQPPALTSSRPRSPNSPLSRPLQQAPQPQLQRVHSPQAMPQQRIVQPKPPVPQQQQSYHQVSPIKQQIPQQSNFQQKPSAPAFVQAIKQQVPPQIKSQQPTPQLAPALVPMSSQVKPQTIVQQTQKPSRPPPQQRSTSQPSKIQPPLTTRPSPAQKSNSFSPTKPPAIRPGTNRSSPSSTSSPKSPLRSSSSNGTSGKLPLDISSKLSQCENIIKLDYINESELIYSSLYTFDPSSPLSNLKKNLGLDDVSINEIIMKNEKLLKDDSKRVVMMITDDGNLYLFKSSTLKKFEFYLKIDLTDKMFAMYDYEFSEFSESGYLILEISKIDKLIFLAPLSKEVKEDLREISNIHIGLNLSWIEALLKTKEFLKSKPSSPSVQSPASSQPMTKSSSTTSVTTAPTSSTSTVKKSQSATTASTTSSSSKVKVSNGVNSNGGSKTMNSKTKPPQAKPPKRPTSKSPTITTQQQIQQQNRKFAGGAAAAAFNAATR
ncbi:unnamed protein product [Wickerhamomyces anomalus]